MTKSVLVASGSSNSTVNTTTYFPIIGGLVLNSTENNVNIPFRTPGNISKLHIGLFSNTTTSTTTVRTRKNNANGNQTISIPSGTTGMFEDTSNSDTIAAGDRLCLQAVPPSTGVIGLRIISILLEPTDPDISDSRFALNDSLVYDASIIFYSVLGGLFHNTTTTTTDQRIVPKITGVFKNWAGYSSAGGRTWGVRLIKNNTDDTVNRILQSTNITGLLENTADTVSIVNTDDVNHLHVYGGGSSNPRTINFIAVSFIHTGTKFLFVNGRAESNDTAFNTTTRYAIGGRIFGTSYEASRVPAKIPMVLSKLNARVSSNTINSGTILLKFMKNNSNGNQSVSIPYGTSGLFEDNSNTDSVAATDLINYEIVISGTSGNIFLTFITMLAETVTLRNLEKTISHAIGLTASHTELRNKIKTDSHNIAITSAHAHQRSLLQLMTHAIVVTAAHSRLRGIVKSHTSNIGITSANSRSRGLWRTHISDITLTSVHSRIQTLLRSFTNNIGGITSAHLRSRNLIQTFTENIGIISTAASRLRELIQTFTESFAISATVTKDTSKVRLITHAIVITTTHNRITDRFKGFTTNIVITSNHSRLRDLVQTMSETFGITAAHDRLRGLIKGHTSDIGITSTASRFKVLLIRTFTTNIVITSTATRLRDLFATRTHNINIDSDHVILRNKIRTHTSNVDINTNVIRAKGFTKTIVHSISIVVAVPVKMTTRLRTANYNISIDSVHSRLRTKLPRLVSHSIGVASNVIYVIVRSFYIKLLRIKTNKNNL